MSQLKPFTLGALIDATVVFWRQHFKLLFWVSLPFQLVQFIAAKLLLIPVMKMLPKNIGESPATDALVQGIGALIVLMLCLIFLAQLSAVAMSRAVYPRFVSSEEPDLQNILSHSFNRILPSAILVIFSAMWAVFFCALFALPLVAVVTLTNEGILGGDSSVALAVTASALLGVGCVVVLLLYILKFILSGQVISVENLSAWNTFKRSSALSSGRISNGFEGLVKVRLAILVTVVGVIVTVIGTTMSLPTFIAGAFFGAGFQPENMIEVVVPQYILVPLQLIETIAASVFVPLYGVFQTLFYIDMRVRREGSDFEKRPTP
jgi:hypothetical protein